MPTLTNKLAVFWKGPSWFPGGPRLGLDEYKINVSFVLYAYLSRVLCRTYVCMYVCTSRRIASRYCYCVIIIKLNL